MQTRTAARLAAALAIVLFFAFVGACAKKQPPVARPMPPPPAATPAPPAVTPPAALEDPLPVPPEPLFDDSIEGRTLDELNRDSPLEPVFFEFDRGELSAQAQATLRRNADIMKTYSSWVVTVEGHCDERGTAEYNLALGERRALSARTYLVSLGIAPERLRTVSYGKEFPFDPGQNEEAWARNRRAHFVITGK
jgi:peptidoglycan-associated lipoprotein